MQEWFSFGASLAAGCGFGFDHAEADAVLFAEAAVPGGLHEGGGAGEGEGGEGADELEVFEGHQSGAAAMFGIGEVDGIELKGQTVVFGVDAVQDAVFPEQVVADGFREAGIVGAQVVGLAVRAGARGDDRREAAKGGPLGEGRLGQRFHHLQAKASGPDAHDASHRQQAGGAMGQKIVAGRGEEPVHGAGMQEQPAVLDPAAARFDPQAAEGVEFGALGGLLLVAIPLCVQKRRVLLTGGRQQAVDQAQQLVIVVDRKSDRLVQLKTNVKSHTASAPTEARKGARACAFGNLLLV